MLGEIENINLCEGQLSSGFLLDETCLILFIKKNGAIYERKYNIKTKNLSKEKLVYYADDCYRTKDGIVLRRGDNLELIKGNV